MKTRIRSLAHKLGMSLVRLAGSADESNVTVTSTRLGRTDVQEMIASKGTTALDLHGVDLTGADLSGLDLSASILRAANLTNTSLHSTQLVGADSSGRSLHGGESL